MPSFRLLSMLAQSVKWIAIAALLAISIAGGVYVGYSFTLNSSQKHRIEAASITDQVGPSQRITVAVGDAFPLEAFEDINGRPGNFEDFVGNHDILIVFSDLDCQACVELLAYVTQTLPSHLGEWAKIVVVLPRENKTKQGIYGGLLTGARIVFVEADHWRSSYNMVVWPTIFGVDTSGIITHIQYGFAGWLDFELADRFLER